MKKIIGLLIFAISFTACETENRTEEVSVDSADSFLKKGNNSGKKASKVAVYHKNEKVIYVDENAVSAHVAHGDAVDLDGDGYFDIANSYSEGVDCDDNNPDVNPGALEIFTDDIDNNCNGVVGYIETRSELGSCAGCTGGTQGNFQNPSTGKCKYVPKGNPPPRRFLPCYEDVIIYID